MFYALDFRLECTKQQYSAIHQINRHYRPIAEVALSDSSSNIILDLMSSSLRQPAYYFTRYFINLQLHFPYNNIIMNSKTFIIIITILLPFNCIVCPRNCAYCLRDNVCQACHANFTITLNATCVSKTVTNCRVQLNNSTCSICEPTFITDNGKCVKDYTGCISRNSKGECEYCWYGTKLITSKCSGLLNCVRGDFRGLCVECWKGYTMSQGICIDNRISCLRKDDKIGACVQCSKGFVMNGFTCTSSIMIPPMCSLFNFQRGLCLSCNIGHQNYRKYCQRKDQIPPLNNQITTRALAMPVDILDASPNLIPMNSIDNSRVSLSQYQDIDIRQVRGNGLRQIKNNCWIFNTNGTCSICIEGYYLLKGKCSEVTIKCLKFDSKNNRCGQCVSYMFLENGICEDKRCAVAIFSRCNVCLHQRHYIDSQGICLISNCNKYSQGKCVQCESRFIFNSVENVCLPIASGGSQNAINSNQNKAINLGDKSKIPGCDLQINNICVRCLANFYPNQSGGCKKVIIGCIKMDAKELNCVQCLSIYKLTKQGQCFYQQQSTSLQNKEADKNTSPSNNNISPQSPTQPSTIRQPIQPIDPYQNCKIRNNGSCGICNQGYFLNRQTLNCQAISPSCKQYNLQTGYCLSCQASFNLFQGSCLASYLQPDPNCITKNIFNFCISCQIQYFRKDGRCLPANTQCRSFNPQGGQCTSCYPGYFILNGICLRVSEQPNCKTYDFQLNCQSCNQRYYLKVGICYPVNALCFNYNSSTGACSSCIEGYGLSSLTLLCQIANQPPTNCASADSVGNCQQCANRFYLNKQENRCITVASFCQNYNKIGGKCIGCFSGYIMLNDNSCVKQELSVGCVSGSADGTCIKCSSQFVATRGGGCLFKQTSCLTYSLGQCTKCANLHYLKNGKCIKQVTRKQRDVHCIIHDIMNYCQNCNSGYYLDAGSCILADQLCRTFDPSNGHCTSCYDGYRLNLSKCFINSPIINCKNFNGVVCLQCLPNFMIRPDGSCL